MTRSIYVIRSESGPVKIGVAGQPRHRLSQLRTASAVSLHLDYAAETDGDVAALESRAHEILKEKRLSGEWFRASAQDAIDAVIQAAYELDIDLRGYAAPTTKKRGRPATGKTPIAAVRLAPDLRATIDAACAAEPDSPSRSELIRRVLTDHLRAKGYLNP